MRGPRSDQTNVSASWRSLRCLSSPQPEPTTPPSELLELIHHRPAWMRYAACREHDPALFFPERGTGNGQVAKAICAGCPVREPGLDYALGESWDYRTKGVWGGLSEEERTSLARQRRASLAASVAGVFDYRVTPRA